MPLNRLLIASTALCSGLSLTACSDEAAVAQPAPPPDRNFTATINNQPVVGGTQQFECVINRLNDAATPQFLLTFTDDIGHTVQVGIEQDGDRVGSRKVLYGMALGQGRAYGQPKDTTAELTAISADGPKVVVSGRFSLQFDLVNAAPGITDREPLRIENAFFEQVECVNPAQMK